MIRGDIVDIGHAVETIVGCTVVSVCLSLGVELREVLQGEGLCFVLVGKHFIFCHLFFGEAVALVHLPYKVEGFGLLRNDDVDALAFLLKFGELATKRDNVRCVGYPGMVECLGCVSVLLYHNLAPVGVEMIDDGLDGLACIAKVFLIEFFDILLLDAVDDALHSNGGDCLL